MNKTWIFPPSGRTHNQGAGKLVNDEFKNNPLTNLAREVIQNSLDANSGNGRVRVEFHLFSTPTELFPCIEEYFNTVLKLYEQYKDKEKNPREFIIINNMLNVLKQKNIYWLRISDFGTTGLWGANETSNHDTPWFAFIKSAGKNQKNQMSGGSKGLGKDAIFANSILTTIFVDTVTINPNTTLLENSSIGITRQPSLKLIDENPNNPDWTQGIGYLVDKNEEAIEFLKHSSDHFFMDPEFLRSENQTGTDIYVPGFLYEEDWDDQLIREAILSFLPAFINNDLELIVSSDNTTIKKIINSSNLKNFVNGNDRVSKMTNSLLNIFTSDKTHSMIYEEKKGFEMTLKILEDSINPLNKVVHYRFPTKMKIVDKSYNSSINYSAVLLIQGDEICSRLRSVENATHTTWAVNRWNDTNYTKDQINEAISTINHFIYKQLESFSFSDDTNSSFFEIEDWTNEVDDKSMELDNNRESGLPTDEVIIKAKNDDATNKQNWLKKYGNIVVEESDIMAQQIDLGLLGEEEGIVQNSDNNNTPNKPFDELDIKKKGGDDGEERVVMRKPIAVLKAKVSSLLPLEGKFNLIFVPSRNGYDVRIKLLKLGVNGETEKAKVVKAILENEILQIINHEIIISEINAGNTYKLNLQLKESQNYVWEVILDGQEYPL